MKLRKVYKSSTEAELVSYLKNGHKGAFDEIYERLWGRLLNDTNKRLRCIEQAEEIVQDVFVELWIKREKRDIIKLYPYLLQSARYQIYTFYKKKTTLPFFEVLLEDLSPTHLQADSLLLEKELQKCIELWHNQEPEKRAQIFRMKFHEDLSTKEISEMLSLAQKTVQNQVINYSASLKAFLAKIMIY